MDADATPVNSDSPAGDGPAEGLAESTRLYSAAELKRDRRRRWSSAAERIAQDLAEAAGWLSYASAAAVAVAIVLQPRG
jgi:hypothetical protein